MSVKAVTTEDSGDKAFVGAVEHSESLMIPTVSTGTKPWTVNILLNKFPVEFQIDTGADVSIIPEDLYKKLEAPLTLNLLVLARIHYKRVDSSLEL